MKKNYILSSILGILVLLIVTPTLLKAQCGSGQSSVDITLDMTNDIFPEENAWKLINTSTGVTIDSICFDLYPAGGIQTVSICLDTGITYTLYALDDYGDGLDGAEYRLSFTYGSAIDTIGTGNFNIAYANCNANYTTNELEDSTSFYVPFVPPPSCYAPDSLKASNLSDSSADVAWKELNGATTWIIEYGLTNFNQGTGTDTLVTTNPFTIDSLLPFSNYDFYVRSICGVGDTSNWSPSQSFKTLYGCPPGAVCSTYTAGVISSDDAFTALPGTSSCPGTMSIVIPAGNRIDSISVFYDMTSYALPNNAWMSEQRTWIYCPTTSKGEAAITNGVGTSAGTLSYERKGLLFAKNASDTVVFEMHAGRTFGGTACDTVTSSIDSNSWKITAYYSPIPSCPEPILLSATNITHKSAQPRWTETGPATEWQIEYDTVNYTFGTGIRVLANSNPFQINGLASGTEYSYYVRSLCSAGDSSIWEGPFSFITTYEVPFVQDFENFAPAITGNPWPEGWSSTTTTDPKWESEDASGINENSTTTGPLYDHTTFGTVGGTYIYMETSGGTNGVNADFVSPPIYIDSISRSVELSYWYFNFGSNIDAMEVIVDSNGVEKILKTYSGQQQQNQTDEWFKDSVIIAGYVGKSIRIKFRGYNVDCCTGDIAIDDVEVDTLPKINTAITSIINPSGSLCPGSINPTVLIENKGRDTITTIDVSMDLNGVTTTQTINRTIATADTIHVVFPSTTISGGNLYDLIFYTTDPNGQTDQVLTNDTISILNLATGLSGTASIDTSIAISASNFHSFSALADQINAVGICGNVTVNVAAASYNDVFHLTNVPGLSSTNRLTIDGGDSALVTLENNLATEKALISFNATSYVTIKNMTLKSNYTGTTDHFGVHFRGASSYDSIVNCRILMNPANDFGAFGVGSSSSIADDFGEGDNANFITVMNCAIDGGSYSVHFEGPSTGNWNVGNAFINNTLTNMDDYGFYTDQQDSMKIIGNTINGMRSNIGDGIACFDHMNFEINANQITVDDYGIYVTNANSIDDADREATLINNMVISTTDHGIYLTSPSRINFYHNTVYNEGGVAAVYFANAIDSLDMRNNVFSSLSNEAFEMSGNIDTTVFLKFDNNVYNTGGTGSLLDINGTAYADLAAYQTARPGYNINSLEGDPQFISTSDLHIVGSFIDESGDNGVNILVDIDGDARPSPFATFVDAGADEYIPPPCATPSNIKVINPGLDSVTIALTGTSMDYEYEFLSGSQTQGNGTIGIIRADTARIGGLTASTTYKLYMRQICRRGDTSPWVGPVSFSTAYGVPYLQDFENFSSDINQNPWPEGWSSTTSFDPVWISYNDANGTVFRSGGTGPLVDHTLGNINGTFIFMETSQGTIGDSADFVSPPIYVNDTLSVVELKYWYFNYGANIDRMEVIVDTNGVENIIATYVGQQQTSQADSWIQDKHLLNGYQGKSIQIKFRGFNVACCSGDIAIDDIEVVIPSPANAGVSKILRPTSGCGLGNADSVEVEIVNSGTDTLSNFSLSYSLNGGTAVSETFSGTIFSGDTAYYTFTSTVNLSTAGTYNIVAYTSVVGDGDTSDDTSAISITSIPVITGFPYTQSFESGNGGWTSGGDINSWELGVPANTIIDTASDGTEAWVTNLTGTYIEYEESWVQSPCLDFTTINVPILELDVWWNTENNYDGATIQSSIDGGTSWQIVGTFGDTVNWYNNNGIAGLTNLEPSEEGWSGRNSSSNGSNGWLTAKHKLDGLGGVSRVILRIAFGSDVSIVDEGFAFDNILISDSLPQLDASASELISPVASVDSCYTANNDVVVKLLNAGGVAIDFTTDSASVQVNVSGAITQSLNLTVNNNSLNGGLALLGGTSINVSLGTINLTTAGTYNFEYIINIASDSIIANDTLYDTLIINQASGGLLSGTDSICSGESTLLSVTNYQGQLQWQELVSGVWTDISGENLSNYTAKPTTTTDYRVLACGTVASDTMTVTSVSLLNAPTAIGDTVLVSCGSTGTATASASSTASGAKFIWFDAASGGNIIDTTTATYSINAAGDSLNYSIVNTVVGTPSVDTVWVAEVIRLGSSTCESPRSMAIVMIDCVTGIEDVSTTANSLTIYPNPSNGIFNLNIVTQKSVNYNLIMRDVKGQLVYTNDIVVEGRYRDQLNFSDLAKGVYFMQIKTDDSSEIRKLVIQ